MLILAFAFVLAIAGTSAAALNQTSNETTVNATADVNCSGSDPIINGTVTVNEYSHVRPLEGATVTANTVSGNVLASTTTDANGYYLLNFYSTDTTFNIIVSYMGCNSITKSVTVSNGPNYPTDPNKYGTSNFQLTPKSATLTSTGNGQTVYIQGQNKNGFAGVINVRVDGTTYVAYCIDLFTPISTDDTLLVNGPLPGTAGDLPSGVDWGKVSYILNHYNPSSDNEAAAIQCAIWYFTSAPYGSYNASAPVGTYYQYMTAPLDGVMRNWWDDYTVRNRALVIIGEAISMKYPYSITVTPSQTTIVNGGTVTVTATVRDINGNPMQGVTVNFQTTKGNLNRNSATTDANGQVTVTLSNIGNNANAVLTAYVSGNYGNLLYDDQYAATRKQNLVARNVLPLTISGFSIINTASQADVTLSQTVNGGSSATVNVGDRVTYVVTATNANQNTATGILISDIIPAGLSGVTVTPSAGTTYYNGVWTIPSLAKRGSVTLTITGTATAAMAGLTTTNTATRTSQEQYNTMSNTTTAGVYTKLANVEVTQTVNGGNSATGNVGDTVTYVITAMNKGLDTATGLQITDLIPTGLSNINYSINGAGNFNSTTGLWNIGTLTAESTTILTITGKITAAMAGLTTTNYANRTAQTEYNPSPATTSTTLYAKIANVTVTQTVNGGSSATGNVGDTVTYIITASNHGLDAATGLQITDLLPSGLTDINYNTGGSGTYNPTTGLWNIGILNSGATAILTITGKITAAMAGLTTTNYANRTAQTEYNPSPATTSTTLYTNQANVGLTQTVNGGTSGTVNVGDTVTIIVTATNKGPNSASNINIAENLPAGFTPTSITPGSGSSYSGGVWTISSLASGANATLTITGKATAAMAGLTTNNTVNRNSQSEYNSLPSSNTATIYTKLSDPIITQTVNGQSSGSVTVNVGDNVTYVVNAYCSGPDNATNIHIKDVVPTGLTGVTVTPSVGSYDSATGIWTIDFLETHTSATLTITGKAGTSMAGTNITNNAFEINQTEYNPAPGNSTSIPVYTKLADVTLTQTGNYYQNTVTFIVTATNNGRDSATNININNAIPAGLTNVTVSPSAGTSYANGVWTIPSLAYLANATLNITGNANPQTTIYNNATKTNQTEYDPIIPDTITSGIYIPAVNIIVSNLPWAYLSSTHSYQTTYGCGNSPVFSLAVKNSEIYDEATNLVFEYEIGDGFGLISYDSRGIGTITVNGNIITWKIDYMPKGGSAFMNIVLKTLKTGDRTTALTTQAKLVSVDQIEINNTNNQMNCSITVPTSADIQVNQNVTGTPNYNETITYHITVTNNGPDTSYTLQITDNLPTGLTDITTKTSVGTYNGGIWTIPSLAVGETATLNITARIIATEGTLINTATKTSQSGQSDWNSNNNAQSTYLTISGSYTPTVDLIVSNLPWFYDKGYLYTYGCSNSPVFSLAVKNLYDEVRDVTFEYEIGDGFGLISYDSRGIGTITVNGNIITWKIDYMPKGGSAFMNIVLKTLKTGDRTTALTTVGRLKSLGVGYVDNNNANNQMNCSITVPTSADIQVNQNVTGTPNYNETITYHITVTNNGPDTSYTLQITDNLPTGLTDITTKTSVGTYNGGIWTIPSLAVGETATLNITARIIATEGTLINTATKTSQSGQSDWNSNNNAQSIYLTVQKSKDLS